MDIEHPACPAIDEFLAQNAHITSERDIFRPCIQRGLFHGSVMVSARHALMGKNEGWNPFSLCQLQSARIGLIAGDQNNVVCRARLAAGIEKRGHIGAAARDEDGDLGLISGGVRQNALPPNLRLRSMSLANRGRYNLSRLLRYAQPQIRAISAGSIFPCA